jgi:hypothetical protein
MAVILAALGRGEVAVKLAVLEDAVEKQHAEIVAGD